MTIDEEDEDEEGAEGAEGEETPKRETGKRLDLEVEASGFGQAMQRELEDVSLGYRVACQTLIEQYMIELQDMPESEGDDEEEEEEEEGEEEQEQETKENKQPEEFDEEAFQKQMSDRLEAMRINKALGNDDPDDVQEEESESDSESEESDDSDSGDSIGPTPTEFSSFDQNRKKRPARVARPKGLTRADELKLTVAQQVGKERESKEKRFHSKKSVNKAGNAKGHKWKNSEAFQVGKNSGW